MQDNHDKNPEENQAQKPFSPIYDETHARKDYYPYNPEAMDVDPELLKCIQEEAEDKLMTWSSQAHKIYDKTVRNSRAMPNRDFPLRVSKVDKSKNPLLFVDAFLPVFDLLGIKEKDEILRIACYLATRDLRENSNFQGKVFARYKQKLFRTASDLKKAKAEGQK